MKTIDCQKDFPKVPHYAIIEWDTFVESGCYPDDDIRRYPYTKYIVCDNETEWKNEIERRTLDKNVQKGWVAIRGNAPATVQVSIKVNQ